MNIELYDFLKLFQDVYCQTGSFAATGNMQSGAVCCMGTQFSDLCLFLAYFVLIFKFKCFLSVQEYIYLKTFLNILLFITSKFYMNNWVLSFIFNFSLIAVLSLVDVSMIPRTATVSGNDTVDFIVKWCCADFRQEKKWETESPSGTEPPNNED